jgi:hypothetical protein
MAMVCQWFDLKTIETVCEWFGLKITRTVFFGFASNPVATVLSGLTLKSTTTVSSGLTSKPVVSFLFEPQNQGGGGFFDLCLKTDSFSLVIWASKSPIQFLGLGLKIKQISICRLHHKTDRGRSTWDTR